ncbi:thioredoxin domain-containing protein [Thermaurantiacus sp.]
MLSPIRTALVLALGLGIAACGEKAGAPKEAGDKAASPVAAAPGGPAAAPQDWSATVVRTPEGGFRMGNPDARVKLVEYASFTCSHCQRFHLEGADPLKSGLVRSGRVSYEFRPFLLNAIDVAAALVAMCGGPQQFFAWTDQLYRNHDAWVTPFTRIAEADLRGLGSLPQDQQVRKLAELGGLDAFVRPRGLTKARFDSCMANAAELSRLMEMQQQAMKNGVNATPSFFLNGRRLEGVTTWEGLRPRIEAALG